MDTTEQTSDKFTHLLEVYIDNFIQLAQTTNQEQLRHLARAVLQGIHLVFPPPVVTGHDGEDPVSMKKLLQGDGLWTVWKEILGWVFDGAHCCIELPADKVSKLTAEIHQIMRKPAVTRKQFEQLRGRLQHACIGILAGKGLMGPIDAELHSGK